MSARKIENVRLGVIFWCDCSIVIFLHKSISRFSPQILLVKASKMHQIQGFFMLMERLCEKVINLA